MSVYRSFLRPILFRMDAEKTHKLTIAFCEVVGKLPVLQTLVHRVLGKRADPLLQTRVAGMALASPIALGAGFDKNGRALRLLSALGFGCIEIGAVSMQPCAGNAGCRAVRLVDEKAVLTRYGVPNDGVQKVASRFARHQRSVPVGINVIWNSSGKPESSIHEVVADMTAALAGFDGLVDYATINFACPNIRGESHFDDLDNVRILFEALDTLSPAMPVFLKFRHRADLRWMDGLVALSLQFAWVRGFIPIVHVMRPMGPGAGAASSMKGSISGAPLKDATVGVVRLWYSSVDRRRHVLVATGGVSSAQDVFEVMAAGATFVQVFTTMVYNGPTVARQMNRELAGLMRAAGIASTAQLTGSARGLPQATTSTQPA